MHPWHDVYVDEHLIEREFPVVIEVPHGSKNKWVFRVSGGWFHRVNMVEVG